MQSAYEGTTFWGDVEPAFSGFERGSSSMPQAEGSFIDDDKFQVPNFSRASVGENNVQQDVWMQPGQQQPRGQHPSIRYVVEPSATQTLYNLSVPPPSSASDFSGQQVQWVAVEQCRFAGPDKQPSSSFIDGQPAVVMQRPGFPVQASGQWYTANTNTALFQRIVAGPPDVLLNGSKRSSFRWPPQLHAAFVEAVKALGGARKATPKKILEYMQQHSGMNLEGLTLQHVKSHVQKYRLSAASSDPEDTSGSHSALPASGMASLNQSSSLAHTTLSAGTTDGPLDAAWTSRFNTQMLLTDSSAPSQPVQMIPHGTQTQAGITTSAWQQPTQAGPFLPCAPTAVAAARFATKAAEPGVSVQDVLSQGSLFSGDSCKNFQRQSVNSTSGDQAAGTTADAPEASLLTDGWNGSNNRFSVPPPSDIQSWSSDLAAYAPPVLPSPVQLAPAMNPAASQEARSSMVPQTRAVPPPSGSEQASTEGRSVGRQEVLAALALQMDLQRQLQEQLQTQFALQQALEEHGRYLADLMHRSSSKRSRSASADAVA